VKSLCFISCCDCHLNNEYEIREPHLLNSFPYLFIAKYAVLFRKKLTEAWRQGMLATIQCRKFYCPVFCPEISNIHRQQWSYSAHANGIIEQSIVLPVVLDGCETWLLTLREEHRLKFWEYLSLRGLRYQGSEENYIIRSLMIRTAHRAWCGW
jgi:hypothetical protein